MVHCKLGLLEGKKSSVSGWSMYGQGHTYLRRGRILFGIQMIIITHLHEWNRER